MTAAAEKTLNVMYMRWVRRAAGCPLFEGGGPTDFEVRVKLGVPSIDCLLTRFRLQYLARVLRGPRQLRALLAQTFNGRRLSWVDLIIEDMRKLAAFHGDALNCLGDPVTSSEKWREFVCSNRWHDCVASMQFTSSRHDLKSGPVAEITRSFVCTSCNSCFLTRKALAQHARVKHGAEHPMRKFLREDGTCPACATCFRTPARLLRHLSDSRRPACARGILEAFQQGRIVATHPDERARIVAQQRIGAKADWANGHSHALARGPAIKADGTVTGRVQL